MESVAVLCNNLNRMLVSCGGMKPSVATLTRTFAAYQAERIPRMKEICELSGLITKVQAWDTPLHKFLGNWVFPLQADTAVASQIGKIVRAGPKLDYVDDAGCTSGRLQWKDKETPTGSSRTSGSLLLRLLGTGVVLLVAMQGAKFVTFASASVTA